MNITVSPMEELFWEQWQLWERHIDPDGANGILPMTRQHPVGKYRLDFALPSIKLGVEIDGFDYHSNREQLISDRRRQRAVEAEGWRLTRFAGSEIYQNAEDCVLQVWATIDRIPITPEIAQKRRRYCKQLMADLGLTEEDIDRS